MNRLTVGLRVLELSAYRQSRRQNEARAIARLSIVGRLAGKLAAAEPDAAEPAAIVAEIDKIRAAGDQAAAQAYLVALGDLQREHTFS